MSGKCRPIYCLFSYFSSHVIRFKLCYFEVKHHWPLFPDRDCTSLTGMMQVFLIIEFLLLPSNTKQAIKAMITILCLRGRQSSDIDIVLCIIFACHRQLDRLFSSKHCTIIVMWFGELEITLFQRGHSD